MKSLSGQFTNSGLPRLLCCVSAFWTPRNPNSRSRRTMAAASSSAQHKRTSSDTYDAPNKKRASADDDNTSLCSEDAITKEEIAGTEAPLTNIHNPRNAFSELMAPKPKPKAPSPSTTISFSGRDGLGAYIANPTAFPASRVIFHTPTAVAIHDLFPKATVHFLLLPRAPPQYSRQHPFDAFSSSSSSSSSTNDNDNDNDNAAFDFLVQVRAEAARLKELAAKELRRLLGRHSAADRARNAILDGLVEPEVFDAEGYPVLPRGRDWSAEIRVGVHSVPSMNHLHVHVLSRDMHSERMKHRKHYNSFTTDFFVPLEDFPLAADDPRRRQGKWPERPMVCWRCGRDFGNKFTQLKEHLEGEFQEWRQE